MEVGDDDEHDSLIGTMVGRYRVEKKIGQGGMGTVYEILQPAIHKRMALKLLHEEYAGRKEIVARFFDEARAVNLISHPNIVDINDFSQLPDGRPFIIMEFLEGQSLEEYLEETGPLEPEEVVDILDQISSALQAAHNTNIVHRDLKPENIFLLPPVDGKHRVKVLDFGIAKLNDEARENTMQTQTGVVLGTPTYMSPEQATGNSQQADHRTDIYSLGIILYEMFVGDPPFVGQTFAELVMKHIQAEPPSLLETRPDLSPRWNDVVLQALQKDPDERFQSMKAFVSAARSADSSSQTAIVAPPPTALPATTVSNPSPIHNRRTSRKPLLIAGAAIFAAAIALVLLLQDRRSGKAESETTPANGPALVDLPQLDAGFSSADSLAGLKTIDAGRTIPAQLPDATPLRVASAPDAALQPSTKPVKIPPDRTRPNSAEKRGKGTLVVSSQPWAIVYLDGKKLGSTPQRKQLSSGRHKVKLKSDFHDNPKSYKFTIKAGKTHRIIANWKK